MKREVLIKVYFAGCEQHVEETELADEEIRQRIKKEWNAEHPSDVPCDDWDFITNIEIETEATIEEV